MKNQIILGTTIEEELKKIDEGVQNSENAVDINLELAIKYELKLEDEIERATLEYDAILNDILDELICSYPSKAEDLRGFILQSKSVLRS